MASRLPDFSCSWGRLDFAHLTPPESSGGHGETGCRCVVRKRLLTLSGLLAVGSGTYPACFPSAVMSSTPAGNHPDVDPVTVILILKASRGTRSASANSSKTRNLATLHPRSAASAPDADKTSNVLSWNQLECQPSGAHGSPIYGPRRGQAWAPLVRASVEFAHLITSSGETRVGIWRDLDVFSAHVQCRK